MEESVRAFSSEPPPAAGELTPTFSVRTFGYDTTRYWSFIETLVSGLQAYEAMRRSGDHAPEPVPAA